MRRSVGLDRQDGIEFRHHAALDGPGPWRGRAGGERCRTADGREVDRSTLTLFVTHVAEHDEPEELKDGHRRGCNIGQPSRS